MALSINLVAFPKELNAKVETNIQAAINKTPIMG